MTIGNLVPEDMANYTCKSRNVAGHHELNGSVTVNCSLLLCLFSLLTPFCWDTQATIPFSCCPSMASLRVRPQCPNARWNRYQEELNSFRLGELEETTKDALVLRGWRLSSRTWNPITSPWMKQLTWLRIVHSGQCLRVALRTPSGAHHSTD